MTASAVAAVTAAMAPATAAVMTAIRRLESFERSGDQFAHRLVRRTRDPGQRDYSGSHERTLRSRTDIAANDRIYAMRQEPQRDFFMSATVGFTHFRRCHRVVRNGVDFELRRLAEVLEYLVPFNWDCYRCIHFSFPLYVHDLLFGTYQIIIAANVNLSLSFFQLREISRLMIAST